MGGGGEWKLESILMFNLLVFHSALNGFTLSVDVQRNTGLCCCYLNYLYNVIYTSQRTQFCFHYKEQINSALQCREELLRIGATVQTTHLNTLCDETQFHNSALFSKYRHYDVAKS
jgi:hypothetical protein